MWTEGCLLLEAFTPWHFPARPGHHPLELGQSYRSVRHKSPSSLGNSERRGDSHGRWQWLLTARAARGLKLEEGEGPARGTKCLQNVHAEAGGLSQR